MVEAVSQLRIESERNSLLSEEVASIRKESEAAAASLTERQAELDELRSTLLAETEVRLMLEATESLLRHRVEELQRMSDSNASRADHLESQHQITQAEATSSREACHKTITELEQEVARLGQQLCHSQQKSSGQVSELESQIDSLQTQLNMARQSVAIASDLQSERSNEGEKLEHLQAENSSLTSQLSNVETTLKALKSEYAEAVGDLSTVSAERDRLQVELATSRESLAEGPCGSAEPEVGDRIATLEADLQTQSDLVKQLQSKLSSAQNGLSDASAKLESFELLVETERHARLQLEEESSSLRARCESLHVEVQQLQAQALVAVEASAACQAETAARIASLESELAARDSLASSWSIKVDDLEKERSILQSRFDQSTAELELLQSQIGSLRESQARSEEARAGLQDLVSRLESLLAEANSKVQTSTEEKQSLATQLATASGQVDSALEALRAENARLLDCMGQYEQRISSLDTQVEELTQSLADSEHAATLAKASLTQLEGTESEFFAEKASWEARLKTASEENAQRVLTLEAELKALGERHSAEIAALRSGCEIAIAEHLRKAEDFQQQAADGFKRAEFAQEALESAEVELQRLQAQYVDENKALLVATTTLKDDLSSAAEERANLLGKLNAKAEQLEHLKAQISELSGRLAASSEPADNVSEQELRQMRLDLAQKEEDYATFRQEASMLRQQHEEEIERLRRDLSDQQEKYAEVEKEALHLRSVFDQAEQSKTDTQMKLVEASHAQREFAEAHMLQIEKKDTESLQLKNQLAAALEDKTKVENMLQTFKANLLKKIQAVEDEKVHAVEAAKSQTETLVRAHAAEIESLKTALDEARKTQQEKSPAGNSLSEPRGSDAAELAQLLQLRETLLKDVEEQNRSLVVQLNDKNDQLGSLQAQQHAMETKFNDLSAQLVSLQKHNDSLKESVLAGVEAKTNAPVSGSEAEMQEKLKKKQEVLMRAHQHITDLNKQLEETKNSLGEATTQVAAMKQHIQKLERSKLQLAEDHVREQTRLQLEKHVHALHLQQASKDQAHLDKIKSLEERLAREEEEFKQYRLRASALAATASTLGPSDESGASDLGGDEIVTRKLKQRVSEMQIRIKSMEPKIASVQELEEKLRRESSLVEQLRFQLSDTSSRLAEINEKEESRKEEHKTKLQDLKLKVDQLLLNHKQDLQRLEAEKEKSLEDIRSELEKLHQQHDAAVRQKESEISNLKDQLELLRNQAPPAPSVPEETSPSPEVEILGLAAVQAQRDLQLQQIRDRSESLQADLLESKKMVELLQIQEKVLKEELRKAERDFKRENTSIEHVKSAVQKFLETNDEVRHPESRHCLLAPPDARPVVLRLAFGWCDR